MKKFLYVLSATLLALTSCSKDENSSSNPATSNPNSSILVKYIIRTYPNNDIETIVYKYDGNKLVNETTVNNGDVISYIYVGNVIVKIERRSANGTFEHSTEYNYANGKVATCSFKFSGGIYTPNYTKSYTYNSNGTVSYKISNGRSGLLTIVNGNIVKDEQFDSNGALNRTETFEYDTKNNPFKNIIGLNLLLDTENYYNGNMLSVNNRIKDNDGDYYKDATFKYDKNNFLIEKKTFNYGNIFETAQYFY